MTKRHCAFIAAAACALAAPAAAQTELDLLGNREHLVATYERMPRAELEQLFLRCDTESSRHPLDFGEGVRCAMAWDTLLRQGFGGDVRLLLAWWRDHREPRPAVAKASPP